MTYRPAVKIDMERLRRMWNDTTLRAVDIYTALGVTREAMYAAARKANLPPRTKKGGKRQVKIDEARLRKLWGDPNLSLADIARLCDVSESGITRARNRYNLPPRRYERQPTFDEDLFRRLWIKGATVQDMADAFNVSKPTIYKRALKLKLPAREPPVAPPDPVVEEEPARPRLAAPCLDKAAPAPDPDYRPPGPWTVDQDALILATKGRYSKIGDLARRWGKPSTVILSRFHRLSRG